MATSPVAIELLLVPQGRQLNFAKELLEIIDICRRAGGESAPWKLVRQVGGGRFRRRHGEVMGMASAPETSVRRQRKLAVPCCRRMCDHHKPAHKLQRFAFYLLAGMAFALSQYNW